MLRIFLITLLLCSCAKTITHKGYLFTQTHLDQLKPHATTKEQVMNVLGSPSIASNFDNEWYYISTRRESVAFLTPKILEQQIVAITFDSNNLIDSIDHLSLDQAQAIAFSQDKTKASGDDERLVKKLFGHVGRFNKDPKKRK